MSPTDSGPGPGGRARQWAQADWRATAGAGDTPRGMSYDPSSIAPGMVTAGSIGEELRALRLLRGLSQKDVAAHLEMSAPQVSQIETGRYIPSLEVISR